MLRCFVLFCVEQPLLGFITCIDPIRYCKANNNPVCVCLSLCLTQDSCLSNHHINWLFSPWLRQGKKWYKCDRQGWWLSLVLSFQVVTLWLNSVGSSSINKVFRRSAVCSPFPSLSEWLSVSVCSARSKCCLGVEIPLESFFFFLGECCQKFIQDYFNDKSTITEMHHSCFLLGVVWERELESVLWKIGSGSFPCHETVTFLWNAVYLHIWKQTDYVSQNKRPQIEHLAAALSEPEWLSPGDSLTFWCSQRISGKRIRDMSMTRKTHFC